MVEIPLLTHSPALQELKEQFDKVRSEEIVVARGERGSKGATTRLRVLLAKMANLCKQARKEIPPA